VNPNHSLDQSTAKNIGEGVNSINEPIKILAEGRQEFIELWGDMGARWGVPRSMTELHALLYIVGVPMNTDDIMKQLSISRGNASMTLRTLLDWGIITRAHRPDDRKDYYIAEQDVWKLFATVARARKRRELEPLTARLKSLSQKSIADATSDGVAHRERIESMLQFIIQFDGLSERFLSMGGLSLDILSKLVGSSKNKSP
jgi:DNA-binding transcriptional regulator GbsR (MarR family)